MDTTTDVDDKTGQTDTETSTSAAKIGDEDFVVNGPVTFDEKGNIVREGDSASTTDDTRDDDRRAKTDDDEFDAPTHDQQGRQLSDADREHIRAERREEKRRRRNAARNREDQLRTTIESQNQTISEMRQRLSVIEGRGAQGELQNLDRQLAEAQEAAVYFKQKSDEAGEANHVKDAVDYAGRAMQATIRARELATVRDAYLRQQQAQPAQQLDPRMVARSQQWMAENSWYQPRNPADQDSQITLAIDRQLIAERFDPTTDAYWDELTKRAKKYLPHRYQNDDMDDDADDDRASRQSSQRNNDDSGRRRQAPRNAGSGGSNGSGGGAKTYVVSEARVRAMQEAGMWNDPEKRARMIKRYQEQDKIDAANRNNRR